MLEITEEQLIKIINRAYEIGSAGCLCWDEGDIDFENKNNELNDLIKDSIVLLKVED